MTAKYDYVALELEYVQGGDDLSVRELARRHGIAAWSTVHAQSRKLHWEEKRAAFRAQVSDRQLALTADKKARLIATIEEDFLTVLHASIIKMGMDLRDRTIKDYDHSAHKEVERVIPGMQVTPSDLTKLITTMQTVLGKPGTITEERHLGIDLSALGLPPEVLREMAGSPAEPDGRPAGRASLPSARGARTN